MDGMTMFFFIEKRFHNEDEHEQKTTSPQKLSTNTQIPNTHPPPPYPSSPAPHHTSPNPPISCNQFSILSHFSPTTHSPEFATPHELFFFDSLFTFLQNGGGGAP